MQQEVQVMQTKAFAPQLNQSRIKKDEEELQALLKQAGYNNEDEEEQTAEAEPSSEEPVSEPVQAESSTEQEEEPKAEAQEDDSELTGEEKTFKKRYGDIRRLLQDKEQEWKLKYEKLEAQLDKAARNELVLPKSEEEIEAWAKKYPDVAGIVEAIADRKANERASDLDKRLSEIESLRVEARRQKAEAELLQLHPDFEQIRSDDEFHDWAEQQPNWIQTALYEDPDDAKSVARAIDLYKADKGITTQAKKTTSDEKSAASSVKAKSRNTPRSDDTSSLWSESKVNKLSYKQYEAKQEEIMEAMKSGNFIYDITKK
jgi:hypothetical protein